MIVRYRTRDGQSGVDVVVPLVTADGTALLVDRGWMATENQGAGPADVPAAARPARSPSRAGSARDATGDSTAVDDHSTRAISSEEIGPAIGHPVYGGFVELRSEDGEPAAGLAPVELPELDNGPHFFYGLQWWFFGLLAIVGFVYLAWDEWRVRAARRAAGASRRRPTSRKRKRPRRSPGSRRCARRTSAPTRRSAARERAGRLPPAYRTALGGQDAERS